MEAEGKVLKVSGKQAVVRIIRKSACSGNCVDCSGCREQSVEISVYSQIPVSEGDNVKISSEGNAVFLGLFVLFILPMIFPLAVYLLTAHSSMAIYLTIAAALLSIVLIWLLSKSKWFLGKTKPRIIAVNDERGL